MDSKRRRKHEGRERGHTERSDTYKTAGEQKNNKSRLSFLVLYTACLSPAGTSFFLAISILDIHASGTDDDDYCDD